jgi:putative transcriptional regulator
LNVKELPGGRIYNRLPLLRAERGLTRQNLADALGVNYQTIGYVERGDYNPSLDLALRISGYFKLPVEMIFSHTPFRPVTEELAHLEMYVKNSNMAPAPGHQPGFSETGEVVTGS